jgi:hypothetical protein
VSSARRCCGKARRKCCSRRSERSMVNPKDGEILIAVFFAVIQRMHAAVLTR